VELRWEFKLRICAGAVAAVGYELAAGISERDTNAAAHDAFFRVPASQGVGNLDGDAAGLYGGVVGFEVVQAL
jgi:hypothetical protein